MYYTMNKDGLDREIFYNLKEMEDLTTVVEHDLRHYKVRNFSIDMDH